MIQLSDLQVRSLGECRFDSPLAKYVGNRSTNEYYVGEDDRILYDDTVAMINARGVSFAELPSFETGGPRRKLFFEPGKTRVGIVTCGGLCPGLNDVIRAVVLELHTHYGIGDVVGFRHGYAGLIPALGHPTVRLTPENVDKINERGGTVLGTSRGGQDPVTMVDRLEELGLDILFVIGGDGSMRGAHNISAEVERRGLTIGVVGIPKTIDNDIAHIGQSFGFQTAFSEAARSITAARVEAEAALGGIGLVKLMGRHAGFIACYAALANHDADFVLIPEVPFALGGANGLLPSLAQRVKERGSAVIVVAEGAGQELLATDDSTDASGNTDLSDIGFYCARLAQTAVHAAMSGRTDMVVGRRRHRFVHVPIPVVTQGSHNVAPDGDLWLSVLESTAQPLAMAQHKTRTVWLLLTS